MLIKTVASNVITRDNIKSAVTLIIKSRATAIAEETLVANTDLEEDSTRVQLAGMVAGIAVATTTKPSSDMMVDKIADKIQSVRENRQEKKAKKNVDTDEK